MKNLIRNSIVVLFVVLIFLNYTCKKEKPTPPILATIDVSVITQNSATCGGTVTYDGGSAVLSRGVCWSINNTPTDADNKTLDGAGTGSFVSKITGVTPNTIYFVRAYATNSAGTAYGNEISFATLSSVSGAPTIGTATAGNGQATVTFTAPVSNGGSAITGYTVTSSTGSFSGTGTTSPITVTGLTNGTAYTFTVTATNAIGTGLASAASNSVTPSAPATVPGAPTIGTATAGNGQATVTFTSPVSNGGSAITGYTVTSSTGSFTATGTASPLTITGLTNGTAYTFTVTATNGIGTGLASAASNSVTPSAPSTVPGAPTIGTATAGNGQATVTFTAPASNGGSAITGYTVTSSTGSFTATGTASPLTVTGLTNGTAYTFTVTANNAIGTGLASAASNSVTPSAPATVPGAPTIGTATAGNGQATITFTAPASNGGSAITGYTVTSSTGSFTATGTASPLTVTGLTNGTAYTFMVTATNSVGNGLASAASNSVTPSAASTVPGAPTIGTATAGNAQATVTFTAPASDGGSAITGYTVTSSPGSKTGTGTATSITVTGLTNGTAYTFTVTATNAIGTGLASTASNSVTPATVPGAPTIGTATAGNLQATVTFTAPVSDGGSAITGYTVTSSPGSKTGTGTATSITVTGLTNGTAYTFTVTATNAIGNGLASAASNSVTPSAPATVPGAPTIGTATAGNLQATVTFTAPASDGGSAITGYTVTSSPGSKTGTGTTSPITVTGLTNGTAYTFTVTATNAIGNGLASSTSNSVTPSAPATVPGAPTIGTATAGNLQATITFTAPASDGGSAITGYTVTSSPGGLTAAGSASPLTVTGLTNGTAYTFTVTATNAIGPGLPSAASNSVTPSVPATVTDIDGNIYNTVTIDAQVWMAENLKTTKYNNNESIGTTSTINLNISTETNPKYQWAFDGNEDNVATYGRLYTWYAVTDSRKICPANWHIPTDAEWTTLTNYLGGESVAGGKLKETGTTIWKTPNSGATNESGFTALPGGSRNSNGDFVLINSFGYWWSSKEYVTANGWYRIMRYDDITVFRSYSDKKIGYAVRCLMD